MKVGHVSDKAKSFKITHDVLDNKC